MSYKIVVKSFFDLIILGSKNLEDQIIQTSKSVYLRTNSIL